MKTRELIVQTARRLFNQRGYGEVTTAALADACNIAEGNLWYHFRTKRDLLEAIAQEFAVDIEARLAHLPDPADPVGSYCAMLRRFMQELRNYRFISRDQPHYGEHVEPIASHVGDWIIHNQHCVAAHLAALVNARLLDLGAGQLREISVNATIIMRYGLEHYVELGAPDGAVRKTLRQHLTLFEDQLDQGAAQAIHSAIEQIDAEAKAAA